mgnify:FL=1|tara:strand:+ start:1010 stop:1180 length:171 start_codon:yes stop_codon:yes gene_type:complete
MKRHFSPYMIQIIELTNDLRNGNLNNNEYCRSVSLIANTYERTMNDYIFRQEIEEE